MTSGMSTSGIRRYTAHYIRADSITGRIVERATSRPIHARSLAEAIDFAWTCKTYTDRLSADQRWTVEGVSLID